MDTAAMSHFPDETRELITSCTSIRQIEAWIDLAVTAGSLEEIFHRS
jgi:hypothetical protein